MNDEVSLTRSIFKAYDISGVVAQRLNNTHRKKNWPSYWFNGVITEARKYMCWL